MEYVCADGTFIPSLIIFKGANLCKDWIVANVPDDWHLSCNTKGWTSNEHGTKWMKSGDTFRIPVSRRLRVTLFYP